MVALTNLGLKTFQPVHGSNFCQNGTDRVVRTCQEQVDPFQAQQNGPFDAKLAAPGVETVAKRL